MRTTLTLDPDTEALLRRLEQERGMSRKEAVNYAIRAGLAPRGREGFRTPTASMGQPVVPLDKALRLAGDLEDELLLDRLAVGT
ncbi:MAG: CopG family transcriptional regulator [Acidimicrobiales bacterium]